MSNLIARLRQGWNRLAPNLKPWHQDVGIVLGYTLVTLVVTWPLATQLSRGIPGYEVNGDQLQKIWTFWYTKDAILHGQNPAHFTTLVYPHGYFSPIRWFMMVIPLIAFPFTLIFSPVATYNLIFLLSYVLTGYTGYLLCRDITADRRAGALGGLVVMLFPLRVAHALSGHLETGSLFLVLLYMMLVRRTLLDPGPRQATLTGVVLALASMVHITFLPYVIPLWTAIYVLYFLTTRAPRFFDWPTWRTLLITAGVALVIMAPFVVPLAAFSLNPSEEVLEGGTYTFSTDLLSYISPSPGNLVMEGLGLVPEYAKEVLAFHPQELLAYLGVIPLILAVLALTRRTPESGIWVVIAGVAMLLALGPYLKIEGTLITFTLEKTSSLITLPYAALTQLPLFKIGRTPGRFNLITGIALAVLAAQGAGVWLRGKHWRSYVLAAAAVGLSLEYLVMWPVEMRDSSIPDAVETLAAEPPTGGVLNVPVDNRQVKHQALYYQTVHHWPIMDGYVSRTLPQAPGLLETFDWITDDTPQSDIIPPVEPEAARALLAEQGVSYVLLHRRHTWEVDAVEARLEAMLGTPLVKDEAAALYRVEPTPPPEDIIYALDGMDWGWVEPWAGEPGRWLEGKANLVVYAPHEVTGALRFTTLSGDAPRHLSVQINDEAPRTLVIGQHLRYTLPGVALQAGYNVMRFDVEEDCWPVQGDAHCIINWPLVGLPAESGCWLSAPFERCLDVLFQEVGFTPEGELSDYHTLEVQVGETVQLMGYSLEEETFWPDTLLMVTLGWQALGTPPEDYNFFVHLLNTETGELAAQYDGAPLHEAYRTSQWLPGDIVQERVNLHLPADLTPGTYALLAGLYRLPSLERLPVHSERPYAQDGLIWLQDVVIAAP